MTTEVEQDHLFISYATEDCALAEWLALRLTAEGYRVWCDRTHLLGGESYPRDIDHAIKQRAFRVLALLSRASLKKPNPTKERTLALNIARERQIDFLIPLNVDGLSATELDWMTSDLTFIPFHKNWASGCGQLLKKLVSIDAPKRLANGRTSVCDWIALRAAPVTKQEMLRSNLLPITEVPAALHKFEFQEKLILPKLAEHWPFYSPTNSDIAWSFAPPADRLKVPVRRITSVSWADVPECDGLRMEDIALSVLRKAITVFCLQKGMTVSRRRHLYFPEGLIAGNRLRFTNYDGTKTFVNVIGERTFKSGSTREKIRYHLSPNLHVIFDEPGRSAVRLSNHLYLTDLAGRPLEGSKVISRRKRICRHWWNHEWLSRFLAVVEWLSDGQAECAILPTANKSLRIASHPIVLTVGQGIDESLLGTSPVEDDAVEINEQEDLDTDFDVDDDSNEEATSE